MTEGHYFDADPTARSRPAPVELVLADMRASLVADRGVFAARQVDPGTLHLLRHAGAGPPAAGDLLDLGSGYGPIACALAHRSPGATVWAVDVNSRAVRLTASNAVSLGLANVRACQPGEVPSGLGFDGIWSNPPVRVGKQALHAILAAWLPRLRPGAPAWLVVQRNLGSDSLAGWLRSEGWAVERAGSKGGYRLLRVSAP